MPIGDQPATLSEVGRSMRRWHLAALLFLASGVSLTVGIARAADIPISGSYGTIAICIMDAFTDIPSGDVNINAGGAPLARVMANEFDTPAESCAFQKVTSQSVAGPVRSWVVESDCSGHKGNVTRVLTVNSNTAAHTITVSDQIGTVLDTVDDCSLPYAERLTRELGRMPAPAKK